MSAAMSQRDRSFRRLPLLRRELPTIIAILVLLLGWFLVTQGI